MEIADIMGRNSPAAMRTAKKALWAALEAEGVAVMGEADAVRQDIRPLRIALLNLMPVYPLDGGQIARELFLLGGSRQAIPHSLILSIVVAVGLALWGFQRHESFMGIMFLMLAYSSYTTLQQYRGQGGFGGGSRW